MSTWKESLRHITVTLSEWNQTQKWASIEVRVSLNFGSPFRYQDIQLGLYCDGEEIAIGYADAQGYWRVQVEGLKRSPEESIFEAQARLSLGRARSQARDARYTMSEGGQPKLTEVATPIPERGVRDEDLRFALPQMIKVRSGTFWMGRSAYAHRVKISRSLQVASVPVTQDLYEIIMGRNPSSFIGPQRPVEQVSFWEAIVFCNKLSERCGYTAAYLFYQENGQPCVEWSRSSNGFRLLTEAEWEYVAKGGREASYAGGERLEELGWYQDNSKHQTHNVGQKQPNPWGLFDCSGNVWEWCFDAWDEHAYHGRKGSLHTDPVVADDLSADRRVRRGGSWVAFNMNCSVNYRFWGRAAGKLDDTGFRVARTL